MAEHTPGPWEARKGGFIYAQIGNDPNWCIGKAYNAPDPTAPDALTGSAIEANGRLIAAAPALLEALETALKQMTDLDEVLNQGNHTVLGWHLNDAPEPVSSFFDDNDHGAIEIARAAIAAAKGEGE